MSPHATPATVAPVFICHASEDRDAAIRIADGLEARGVHTWIAPRSIPAGANFPDAIIDGIGRCSAMVVVVSHAANAKSYVKREVERADKYGKPLFPCLLDDAVPEQGLALFLSSPQQVRVDDVGFEGAVEAIIVALGLHATPVASSPRRRSATRKLAAGIAAVLALSVVVWAWLPDQQETADETEVPDIGPAADASDPDAVARALIGIAGTGDEKAIRARFTPTVQVQFPDHLWTAMAAQARQFASMAAAAPEIVFRRKLPRRLVPGPDQVTLVVAERHASGSWYCDQVQLRGDDAKWTPELYNFWIAVDGRCLSEHDVVAATMRAEEIAIVLAGGGEIADSDISRLLAGYISKPEWSTLLANIRERTRNWSPAEHLVGAAPLSNMQWPGTPGRFVAVRYAVDRGGTLLNLDVTLQQEADGVWRLAGLHLVPWAG